MAKWNLVDLLSTEGEPRRFHPPLASIPPGRGGVCSVAEDQFEPEDAPVRSGGEVKALVFSIRIRPPSSGAFTDEGTMLPDPALRLHAMAPGFLRFKPADAEMRDRLILEMPMFSPLLKISVRWWERWIEADCYPSQIVYENVDRRELEKRLAAIELDKSLHGLRFPAEVADDRQKADFIGRFMKGDELTLLEAGPGAVIGAAATDPDDASCRLLKLRGSYEELVSTSPSMMNPREFLYLLFGNDSDEADNHPLLRKMEKVGQAQSGLETSTMRLRPPLRTHRRVMWEADAEVNGHKLVWMAEHACHERFFNTLRRAYQGRSLPFVHSRYDDCEKIRKDPSTGKDVMGCNKCNVFISDVALRAGFRVGIRPVGPDGKPKTTWHYVAAGKRGYTQAVDDLKQTYDRQPLIGDVEGVSTPWGYKIEKWMRWLLSLKPPADPVAMLNEVMSMEGRCLVLAGSRATGSGHIVLVDKVLDRPTLVDEDEAGHGLKRIKLTTREARTSNGADARPAEFALGPPDAGPLLNFVRLHLFELHPGKDPDTPRGLQDCNVRVAI